MTLVRQWPRQAVVCGGIRGMGRRHPIGDHERNNHIECVMKPCADDQKKADPDVHVHTPANQGAHSLRYEPCVTQEAGLQPLGFAIPTRPSCEPRSAIGESGESICGRRV